MVSIAKTFRSGIMAFLLAVISTSSTVILSSELSLGIPKDSERGSFCCKEEDSLSSSAIQAVKYFSSAARTGVSLLTKNAKVLFVGLALLPTGQAFTVTNLNQVYPSPKPFCPQTFSAGATATCSIYPLIIENALAMDTFSVSIRQSDLTVGTLGTRGKSKVVPTLGNGFWNATGTADEINALISLLYFTNNNKLTGMVDLYPQIKNIFTGETLSGQITLGSTLLDATNLPQFKNYTGQVQLDPIVVKNTLAPFYSVRLSLPKDAGALSFPNSVINTNVTDESSSGMYSRTYAASGSLSDINSILGNVRCIMVKNYVDLPLGVFIKDDVSTIYNVVLLTSTTPPTVATTSSTETPSQLTSGFSTVATITSLKSTSTKTATGFTQTTTSGIERSTSSASVNTSSQSSLSGSATNQTSSVPLRSTQGRITLPYITTTQQIFSSTSQQGSSGTAISTNLLRTTDVKFDQSTIATTSQLPVIIGSALGGIVLLGGGIALLLICRKNKGTQEENGESQKAQVNSSQYDKIVLRSTDNYNQIIQSQGKGEYNSVNKVPNNYEDCASPFGEAVQYDKSLPRNPVQYDKVLSAGERS